MEAGGIRTRNHPLIRRSNSNCSLGSRQFFMRRASKASERPGQKSARCLALAGTARGKPPQRLRSTPTCSPGRNKPCEMHRETKGGKGPHLRTLAGALPLLSGKRWKGETKYPYLAASRRAAPCVRVRSLETRAGKAPDTPFECVAQLRTK